MKKITPFFKRLALAVPLLTGACGYSSIEPNGARLSGISTPLFAFTRVSGVDPDTIHSGQNASLLASENEAVRCIGALSQLHSDSPVAIAERELAAASGQPQAPACRAPQ